MYTGKLVFSQVMEHLPLHVFHQCVDRYNGNFKIKEFTCLDQYLCMAFAQLTYRESLRDIESCLRAQKNKLYHMGIRSSVSRNNLSNANKVRDWRIYADLAYSLIQTARNLYVNESFGLELENTVYALDATTIDLCLSMFPWANFRKIKGAIKLHTLLDLRGSIPTFIHISDGKLHEVNTLDIVPLEAGAFYVMDRGYLDFKRLYTDYPVISVLCDQSQMPAGLFPSGGQGNRPTLRSIGTTHRLLSSQGLSGQTASGEVSRRRERPNLGISDQQFYVTGLDHCRTVSLPLAGGTLLPLDQAEPADQNFLWHLGERSQGSNLDCRVNLCASTM